MNAPATNAKAVDGGTMNPNSDATISASDAGATKERRRLSIIFQRLSMPNG